MSMRFFNTWALYTGLSDRETSEEQGWLAMNVIENSRESIVDRATFEQVQEMKGEVKKEALTK